MNSLHLNLKKKWFDMIKSGEKKEEYREISGYWARRLILFKLEIEWQSFQEFIEDLRDPERRHENWQECMSFFGAYFRGFGYVHFKNGYARRGKPAPCFDIDIKGIRVGAGKPELGAEPGKEYFIIRLGDILP